MLELNSTRNVGLILDTRKGFPPFPIDLLLMGVSRSKLQSGSDKNPSFSVVKELSKVLAGEHSAISTGTGSLNVLKYKYVALTTADIEHFFSAHRPILCEYRCGMKP